MDDPEREGRPRGSALLATYARDLRTLVGRDFRETILVPAFSPSPEDTLQELILKASEVEEHAWEPAQDLVARLPWALMNCGLGLLELRSRWPARTDLTEIYLQQARAEAGLGLPSTVARVCRTIQERWPQHADWLLEVGEQLRRQVTSVSLTHQSVEELAEKHFRHQCWLSREVRKAEIMVPEVVAAAELFGAVVFLRRASYEDLAQAREEGKENRDATLECLRRRDLRGDLVFEDALQAVLGGPNAFVWESTEERNIEVLHFALAVRQQRTGLTEHGLLEQLELS